MISLNNADNFFTATGCHFSPFGIIKIINFFHDLRYVFKHKQNIFFSFLAYKTLRPIVTLIFSIFFQLPFSDGKFIPSQLYLFIKSLFFVILRGSFSISS